MVVNHFLYHIKSTVALMISIAPSNGEDELSMDGRSAHQCLVAIHYLRAGIIAMPHSLSYATSQRRRS